MGVIDEQDGLRELHHLEPILLADRTRPVLLQDLIAMKDVPACVLLELPQREIGGQLPQYAELEAMSAYCRERRIKLHLDGARLFEVLPYYGKTAQEVCALFDSVYISVYKGIGGVVGAILAGSREFADRSKVWKRRHGGDLISLYPYILAADYYMEQRLSRMGEYYQGAKELAVWYNGCCSLRTIPTVPVSNMFHVHCHRSKAQLEAAIMEASRESGVGFASSVREREGGGSCYEVSIGDRYAKVPKTVLEQAFQALDRELRKLDEAGIRPTI
ncbi:beta-eliminating lyase-related protein [Paenibacillus sp. PL2-23]|uniref:threonine aldolase family protein n=1 Tax=Paenibacillus sp. PL2-23 TaxID=2100729 RepID=UPI0030F5D5CA